MSAEAIEPSGVMPSGLADIADPARAESAGVILNSIDQLLEDFGASDDAPDVLFVEVKGGPIHCVKCAGSGELEGGATCDHCDGNGRAPRVYLFAFRRPEGIEEVQRFSVGARKWVAKMLSDTTKPPALAAALDGRTASDLVTAFTLYFWAAKDAKRGDMPAINLDAIEALKLTRAPAACDMLLQAIDRAFSGGYQAQIVEAIEAEKKG